MNRAVERHERFLFNRRGAPAVIIMSVDDYLKTITPEDPAFRQFEMNPSVQVSIG
jgi:hypothetical protein